MAQPGLEFIKAHEIKVFIKNILEQSNLDRREKEAVLGDIISFTQTELRKLIEGGERRRVGTTRDASIAPSINLLQSREGSHSTSTSVINSPMTFNINDVRAEADDVLRCPSTPFTANFTHDFDHGKELTNSDLDSLLPEGNAESLKKKRKINGEGSPTSTS